MGEAAEQRQGAQHGEPEQVAVLLLIDATLTVDETGFLPIAVVLENIKQGLAPMAGVDLHVAHASIREHRDEMLACFEAANDEEARRG